MRTACAELKQRVAMGHPERRHCGAWSPDFLAVTRALK